MNGIGQGLPPGQGVNAVLELIENICSRWQRVTQPVQPWGLAFSQSTKRRPDQNEGQQAAAQSSLHKPSEFVEENLILLRLKAQTRGHDLSCTPHHLQGNSKALLHGLNAQIIQKDRLALAQQHRRQQHRITQVLAL